MKLHDLAPAKGSRQKRKRVGRGQGSGLGKTAGRGEKGQKSRSGYSQRIGFEGGQMPLIRRVPKRGFTNIFRTEIAIVNLRQLAEVEGPISPDRLYDLGMVPKGVKVKVLGDGEVTTALSVKAHKFSRSAREKIEGAGGSCEELEA